MTDARYRYPTAAAFRFALEDHLRRRAHSTSTPLDRLRKEIAHQRLLARLAAVAPSGSWALKGGQALLARRDSAARATKDADATWRVELAQLEDMLAIAWSLAVATSHGPQAVCRETFTLQEPD